MLSFLKKLFRKPARQPVAAPSPTESDALPLLPVCAFCSQPAEELPSTDLGDGRFQPPAGYQPFSVGHFAHAAGLWRCACGAVGSGAWAPDLDEVADLLLELLGLDASVSQPCVPMDDSGRIQMQRYDVPAMMQSLDEIMHQHGFELHRNAFRQGSAPIQCLWVRPNKP